MKFQLKNPYQAPLYYTQHKKEHSEVDVPSILVKDGILKSDFDHENLPLSDIDEILNKADNSISWCRRIVNTENNSATLISQLPGEGNRLHYHPNWNEWWYIIRGEWEWEVEGEKMPVKKGQMVFIPKNKWHKITAIGDNPAVRLAVSRADVAHVYKDEKI
jgi:quercetin dioxygenase-like cupin family protein